MLTALETPTSDQPRREVHADTHNAKTPDFGRRVLITLVDDIATAEPTRPFTFIPKSSNLKDGWKPVTFRQIANAVNHRAHDISNTTRGSTKPFPTIAYIGPSDVRYVIILLACIKAGCKALFISPRNTVGVQVSLFESANCNYLYYTESFYITMKPCLEKRKMKAVTVTSVDEWLSATAAPFPYNKSFDEAQWDPLVVLHTSGSTGIPKPITVRQGSLAIADSFQNLSGYQGGSFFFSEWAKRSKRLFMSMPMFHAVGTICMLSSIFYNHTMAMALPDKPLNVVTALECLAHAGVDSAILPLAILEGLSATEEGIKAVVKLAFVVFGGGEFETCLTCGRSCAND
jgi:acyl-CoA synthetase (AMP-forming)/AMP-acid ligase II